MSLEEEVKATQPNPIKPTNLTWKHKLITKHSFSSLLFSSILFFISPKFKNPNFSIQFSNPNLQLINVSNLSNPNASRFRRITILNPNSNFPKSTPKFHLQRPPPLLQPRLRLLRRRHRSWLPHLQLRPLPRNFPPRFWS